MMASAGASGSDAPSSSSASSSTGLRGVVSKVTGGSLVVSLDGGAALREAKLFGGEAARGEAEVQAEAALAAKAADEEATARSWMGGEVRVDFLGSDVTFARNLAGLETMGESAKLAQAGKAAPHFSVLSTVHGSQKLRDAALAKAKERRAAAGASGSMGVPEFEPFDASLSADQAAAVDGCLSSRLPLSVVQGPPGSGKTSMIVELVRRAVGVSGLRLLVVAPSNMAVDNLCVRLAAVDPALRLVRVGDPQRIDAAALSITAEKVAERRASALEEEAEAELARRTAEVEADGAMGAKRKAQMKEYLEREIRRMVEKRKARGALEAMADAQVVLCTTTASGEKTVRELPPFDLVVVDEAAQSTSPNAWLPLLCGRRAVLVGDPEQLPPTLLSREAARDGLQITLMEEATQLLGKTEAYTLLGTQYRMNRAISDWSSAQFYEGKLSSHPTVAGRTLRDLPRVAANVDADAEETLADVVLLTLAVERGGEGNGSGGGGNGGETRSPGGYETRSPGGAIVNHAEARTVVDHVASLLEAGVAAEQIAVISPYTAQVGLLKRLLAKSLRVGRYLASAAAAEGRGEAAAIEVATVDSFQGREAEAVVLSLVRSNPHGSVGFLADRRRLNVAVTRARRHLAIVCDPSTVRSDALLDSLLVHAEKEGVWRRVEASAESDGDRLRGVVQPSPATTRR